MDGEGSPTTSIQDQLARQNTDSEPGFDSKSILANDSMAISNAWKGMSWRPTRPLFQMKVVNRISPHYSLTVMMRERFQKKGGISESQGTTSTFGSSMLGCLCLRKRFVASSSRPSLWWLRQ